LKGDCYVLNTELFTIHAENKAFYNISLLLPVLAIFLTRMFDGIFVAMNFLTKNFVMALVFCSYSPNLEIDKTQKLSQIHKLNCLVEKALRYSC